MSKSRFGADNPNYKNGRTTEFYRGLKREVDKSLTGSTVNKKGRSELKEELSLYEDAIAELQRAYKSGDKKAIVVAQKKIKSLTGQASKQARI